MALEKTNSDDNPAIIKNYEILESAFSLKIPEKLFQYTGPANIVKMVPEKHIEQRTLLWKQKHKVTGLTKCILQHYSLMKLKHTKQLQLMSGNLLVKV